MLNPADFRMEVIRPSLEILGLWSESAEDLLLGTALVESGLKRLHKNDNAGLGLFGITEGVAKHAWRYVLARSVMSGVLTRMEPKCSIQNLSYAVMITRINYEDAFEPLPRTGDIYGQASFWKRYHHGIDGPLTDVDFINKARPWLRRLREQGDDQ